MGRVGRSLSLLAGAILLALASLACGQSESRRVVTSSEAAFVPVIESSDIFVGVPRLALTLLARDAQPEFQEGAVFLIRYFEPTEGGIKFRSEAELTSIDVGGLRYLIADAPPFDVSGQWALAVAIEMDDGTAESTPRLSFVVRGLPRGLEAGDAAPAIKTPTIADGVLERMSPMPDDDLRMYERSASELIAAGEPFLIIWGSAERCAGRLACARALEQARAVLGHGRIAVLHVEPFGRPRAGALQALIDEANAAWTIEAEPQLFVVDKDGRIASHFEIVVEPSQLEASVDAVLR